jgi:predicted nucleic acid-binding protein
VKYLVDANVLSEPTRTAPSAKVAEWLRVNEPELVLDPIILGEVRYGIHLLPAGKRRRNLQKWFDSGVARINCLSWTAIVGLQWAQLLADLRSSGQAMAVKDSMIAATALVHGLIVATRNVQDFKKTGVRIINPFE